MKHIAQLLLAATLSAAAASAFAGPECTQADKSTWQDQDKFRKDLETQGYQIKKFKVTEGNCYEIYGKNKEGQKVEIYFNPVDGKIAKQEID